MVLTLYEFYLIRDYIKDPYTYYKYCKALNLKINKKHIFFWEESNFNVSDINYFIFIDIYNKQINWEFVNYKLLSEDFIKYFKKYLNINTLLIFQNLNDKFIFYEIYELYLDDYLYFPEKYIYNENKFQWVNLFVYQKKSNKFWKRFIKKYKKIIVVTELNILPKIIQKKLNVQIN